MKKIILISALLTIFFGTTANAQVDIGLIGGMNFANITEKNMGVASLKGDTKFGIGAVADIALIDDLTLRFEPMYITKGAVATPSGANAADFYIKLSYLELPFLLKYSIGTDIRPYLLAGAALSYNTSADMETEISGIAFMGDVSNIINSLEYSLSFGAGVSFCLETVTLFVEGKYTLGLNDIVSEGEYVLSGGQIVISEPVPDNVEIKNKGLQIFAGAVFPLDF